MRVLFMMFFSLNVFAFDPTQIKVINCKYGADQDIEFTTVNKQFFFNRVYNDRQLKLSVKDTDKFSEVEDYMTVSDFKGHKITYSLKCNKVSK